MLIVFVKNSPIPLLAGLLTERFPHLCLSVLMCESVSMCVCLPAAKLAHVCVGWRHSVSSGPEDTVNRIRAVWRELRRCDRGQYQIPWPILCPVVHTKDKKHRGNRGYCSLFIITTTQHNTQTHAYTHIHSNRSNNQEVISKIPSSYWNSCGYSNCHRPWDYLHACLTSCSIN